MTAPRVVDSGSLPQQIAQAVAAAGRSARMLTGLVTAVDGSGGVTVNVDGAALTGLSLPAVPLQAGDAVRVLKQGGTYQVLGLVVTQDLPVSGTVTSVPVGSAITVSTSIGPQTCGFVASYTPAVNDVVWILWLGSTPLVLGKQGAVAPPPSPPAPAPRPPAPSVTTGVTYFTCTGSGTYRGGQWLSNGISDGNVMQGDYGYGPNEGAWFYSGRPHATLNGATVTDCKIWLGRAYGGTYAAQTVHLIRVGNNTQPAGALSFDTGHATDSIALAVGQSGWFDLPNGIAQALVNSGGSMGVTSADPYVRLLGRPNDTRAGQLRITWRRS